MVDNDFIPSALTVSLVRTSFGILLSLEAKSLLKKN